jgi:hypothetical protein
MSFGGVLAKVILSPVDSFARDVRYILKHKYYGSCGCAGNDLAGGMRDHVAIHPCSATNVCFSPDLMS